MRKNKIWYHGTSYNNWKMIQKEGILLGKKNDKGKRFTFLALEREEADVYGDITLRVEYDPESDLDNNNFIPHCLEVRTITPIPLSNLRRI